MGYYTEAWKRYVDFGGRSRRAAYWYFVLFNIIAEIVLTIVDSVVGTIGTSGPGVLGGLYLLAALLPGLGVSVRRLHDTGRSGWWLLISFVPLIGSILLLIWFLSDSQPMDNAYGPNPKGTLTAPA